MAKKSKRKTKSFKRTGKRTKKVGSSKRAKRILVTRTAAAKKRAVKKRATKKKAVRKNTAVAKKPKSKSAKPKSVKSKSAKPKTKATTPKPKPKHAPDTGRPRYYITTAISYPNGVPHIGHAYEAIATDAIARFMRLDGYDVFFLTGTDEHGQKIQQTAAREGLTARELLERNVPRFQAMVERMNCSNDDFIRTTEPRHYDVVEGDLGDDAEEWRHLSRQICRLVFGARRALFRRGRDPSERAGHAPCDRDRHAGRVGGGGELFLPAVRLSGQAARPLCASIPDFVLPKERLNEVASFVKGGLQDLSISRTTFDWGIRVPGNDKHIMYVWVDALTNYITAVGYPDIDSELFKRYWPADLHVIGKDIVRFHAVYWPAFLMSAGVAVPRRIFSHGFLFNRGEKMSKSTGNVVDPFTLADTFGVDQVRYFFLREVPFGQDGNYSYEAIASAHQCRACQRSRQSRAALAVDDRKAARRRAAGAGRVLRQRSGDPGRGRRDDRGRARGDEDASSCIRCSIRSGPWSPTPTAISRARRPGRWPRPIRRGRARCSMSPPR